MAKLVPYHEAIRDKFSPAVAVVSDAAVQEACQSNGLSLVDILRACSVNATVWPSGEHVKSLPAPSAHFLMLCITSC
jgi:hypothetical protein